MKKAETFGIRLKKVKTWRTIDFKNITKETSERREYSDKSLEYYEHFYDVFGEQAEFLIASLNFSDYMSKLQGEQSKLEEILDKLRLDLSKNPHSEKKNKINWENILANLKRLKFEKQKRETWLKNMGKKILF